jgi:hypothetical protein
VFCTYFITGAEKLRDDNFLYVLSQSPLPTSPERGSHQSTALAYLIIISKWSIDIF